MYRYHDAFHIRRGGKNEEELIYLFLSSNAAKRFGLYPKKGASRPTRGIGYVLTSQVESRITSREG